MNNVLELHSEKVDIHLLFQHIVSEISKLLEENYL